MGTAVGALVGVPVGMADGSGVGIFVGDGVGDVVGAGDLRRIGVTKAGTSRPQSINKSLEDYQTKDRQSTSE